MSPASPLKDLNMADYVPSLRNAAVVRMVKQLSEVYSTMRIEELSKVGFSPPLKPRLRTRFCFGGGPGPGCCCGDAAMCPLAPATGCFLRRLAGQACSRHAGSSRRPRNHPLHHHTAPSPRPMRS